MQLYIITVSLVVLPCFVICQIPFSNLNQYSASVVGDLSQQQNGSISNQFHQPNNAQISTSSASSSEKYIVGNLSQPFTFQVAPPSIKVTYLGLNGHSLYIMGVGFSNKSKFNYDEKTNRLTILSLDSTTVGYYSAVDANWKTFTTILSAINISSLQIYNSHVSEDNNGSSLVSCSVSIIHSTFKLAETSSKSTGTENLPRLDLFVSTRATTSVLSNTKIYNDSLNEQNFTRRITLQRPLTRADHNGTIQCQVESNNNIDIYLIKTVPIDIEYGPNLETGALPSDSLKSEAMKMIAMQCQIEANPTPSYVWYETSNTISSDYNQILPSGGETVFGTTREIQRIYQYPGNYTMQCQAQSRGKTVKQDFIITVSSQLNAMKLGSDADAVRKKSYKIPIIIGSIVGSILLLLVAAIIAAAIIYLRRQKLNPDKKSSMSNEKLSNDKQGKTRWGPLPIDYSKYKHESLKADSSSTSHLVESAETNSLQAPPVPARPSPMTSTHSSYRQTPSTTVSFSYRQASALPGFRSTASTRAYSPTEEDNDEVNTNINPMPLTNNRSRTNTPFGSHKSLSESIQSLRSNQQPAFSLPVKKRPQDPPTLLPKREQRTSPTDVTKDYQHHHYHNPAQLHAEQQQQKIAESTSSEEDFEPQQTNQTSEASPVTGSTTSGYNQVDFHHQNDRRIVTPSPAQKMVLHQPQGIHHDEAPPSYHQIANKPSPSHAYAYQEPTEV
ncbi:hypothetical protein I4U23_026906 [Adineta vaga]|nr:hypothetical protein I4U23_026906 [Adineta vaga]